MPEPMKRRLRLIDLCAVLTLGLLVGGTGWRVVWPLYRRTLASQKQAAQMRDELEQLQGLSRSLPQVEADITQTQDRLHNAEALLPRSGEMDQFMGQMAQVAQACGLRIDGVVPKTIDVRGAYHVLPVEISGTATFDAAYKFVVGLQKMDRLTRLDDLSVRVNSNVNDKGAVETDPQCNVTIALSTFITR